MKTDSNIKKDIRVILHNIRSVHNAGSIFRTSDAVGVTKIYITGYTPSPQDRFGNERDDFKKVSLGSENTVEWESKVDLNKLITELKEEGFFIVCVEQSNDSLDYKEIPTHQKTTFIFGNEVDGIPEDVLNECDVISEIPMHGQKESLNVSVALGIILAEYRDRN